MSAVSCRTVHLVVGASVDLLCVRHNRIRYLSLIGVTIRDEKSIKVI